MCSNESVRLCRYGVSNTRNTVMYYTSTTVFLVTAHRIMVVNFLTQPISSASQVCRRRIYAAIEVDRSQLGRAHQANIRQSLTVKRYAIKRARSIRCTEICCWTKKMYRPLVMVETICSRRLWATSRLQPTSAKLKVFLSLNYCNFLAY